MQPLALPAGRNLMPYPALLCCAMFAPCLTCTCTCRWLQVGQGWAGIRDGAMLCEHGALRLARDPGQHPPAGSIHGWAAVRLQVIGMRGYKADQCGSLVAG